MSEKFDSLMIILNRIDSGARVTMRSLCEDLEKEKRTIYRYISTLVKAGFPVEYRHSVGCYKFQEGYTLKKPHLSVEEALAFSLAKKFLGNFGPGMQKSLDKIEEKLSFKRPAGISNVVFSPGAVPSGIEVYLTSLYQAIADHQKMKITYRSFSATKDTTSTVNPYYLFFNDGLWYFRGHYEADRAVRTFALDRIKSLIPLDRYFAPPGLKPEDELSGAFGAFFDGEPVDIVLKFDEIYKPLIQRKKWHPSQESRELPDGSLEVTFRVNGTDGIRNWVYQWMPHVEVVAPREFRDMFRGDLDISLKKQGKK